jgi:hypothetical protein
MFEEILEFKNVTIFYYGRQKYVALQQMYFKPKCVLLLKRSHFPSILIVLTCAMKSTKGPFIVVKCFDKTTILLMNMEVELLEFFSKTEISNPFEVDIFLLHRNMWLEVMKVIKPLWGFLRSFNEQLVHNMMTNHVGSMLQVFAHCEKLNEARECNFN